MDLKEMQEGLASGKKLRRPSWPTGDYVEVPGTGQARVATPGTMTYYENGVDAGLWSQRTDYITDFTAGDFEELT